MKTLLVLILCSLSLAAGGVVTLYVNGTNVMSPDLWSLAFRGLISAPSVLVGAAWSGSDVLFYRGIVVAAGGILLAIALGGVAVLLKLALLTKSILSTPRKAPKGWGADDQEKDQTATPEKPGSARFKKMQSAMGGIWDKLRSLTSRRRQGFVDSDADLDGDDVQTGPGFFSRLGARIKAAKPRGKTLVIKSGHEQEIILAVEDEGSFLQDLKGWYASIKNADKNDPVCIAAARTLQEKASKRARAKVLEEDAMNGLFMLRMLDAWAGKKTDGTGTEPQVSMGGNAPFDPHEASFTQAIKDVMEEGVSVDHPDDDAFQIEDIDDEDDAFIIHDFDAEDDAEKTDDVADDDDFLISDSENEAAYVTSEDEADPLFDVAEQGDEMERGDTAIGLARDILKFEDMATAVDNFETEWPEHLADADLRREHVRDLFKRLSDVLANEGASISELSSFDAEEDHREIEWLQGVMDDLTAGEEAIMSAANGPQIPDDLSSADADLDAAFSFDVTERGSVNDSDDAASPVDQDHDDVSPLPVAEEVEDSAQDEAENDDIGSKESDTDVPAHGETEAEVLPCVPVDRSIGELEEIAQSGELIYNWGYIAKSAGAAEAKISHSVISKDGLRRRVVGIVHLVARWRQRESEDTRQLNIVLRYVPAGEWSLDLSSVEENGLRMVDSNGDFVQVSPHMLKQPEIAEGVLLVHFYGPGARPGTLIEEGNIVVTTDALSAEQVQKTMKV